MASSHCPSCCTSCCDAIGSLAECQILSIRTCPDGSVFEHWCPCCDVHVLLYGGCARVATLSMVEKVSNCLTIGPICDLLLHGCRHHVGPRLSRRHTSVVGCFLLVSGNICHFRIHYVLHPELHHESDFFDLDKER